MVTIDVAMLVIAFAGLVLTFLMVVFMYNNAKK